MPQHDDGQDDVSALTFFTSPQSASDDSGVDALRAQSSSAQTQDTTTDVDALRSTTGVAADDEQEEDEAADFLAKVTNLPGTVSVTALPDGSVMQIELRAKVTSMSESALADEILVIADLARQKGLAKQQAFIVHAVQEVDIDGVDAGAAGDLILDSLELPTPEQAEAAQAEVFATRYAASTD